MAHGGRSGTGPVGGVRVPDVRDACPADRAPGTEGVDAGRVPDVRRGGLVAVAGRHVRIAWDGDRGVRIAVNGRAFGGALSVDAARELGVLLGGLGL